MAQVLPIAALQAKERATEALKGDVYTRRWSSTKGKGKKKREVEHTVHVNPASVGVGAVGLAIGVGVAAVGGALTLRWAGFELKPGPAKMVRLLRVYETSYKTVEHPEVSHYETRYDHFGASHSVKVVDSEAWSEQIATGQRAIVFTKRGVPIREWKEDSIAQVADYALSERERTLGWSSIATGPRLDGNDRLGAFSQVAYTFQNTSKKGYAMTEKKDEGWVSKIFGTG